MENKISDYEFYLNCGHDEKGARSIADDYCVKCGRDCTGKGGSITNSGLECTICCPYPY